MKLTATHDSLILSPTAFSIKERLPEAINGKSRQKGLKLHLKSLSCFSDEIWYVGELLINTTIFKQNKGFLWRINDRAGQYLLTVFLGKWAFPKASIIFFFVQVLET